MVRFAYRVTMEHRTRVANGDSVVFPADEGFTYRCDHFSRCQLRTRRNNDRLFVPGGEQFHVRATNVDDEDLSVFHYSISGPARAGEMPRSLNFLNFHPLLAFGGL